MEFKTATELGIYLRNEIDKFSGEELPVEFIEIFMTIYNNQIYKKMMYKGVCFAPGFLAKIRQYRADMLTKIIKDHGQK